MASEICIRYIVIHVYNEVICRQNIRYSEVFVIVK